MSYHLTHPDSDTEIEVDASQAPMYISQGWRTKPGAAPIETDQPVDPNATRE